MQGYIWSVITVSLQFGLAVITISMIIIIGVGVLVRIEDYLQMPNAKFNAKDYGTVAYDFAPDAPVAKGIIPDPSDDMLQQYHKDIRQLLEDAGINDLPSPAEMRLNPERMDEYMDRLDKYDIIDTHHRLLEIIATICSGTPSVEDMMLIPYRKRIKFIRFVQKELTNPEA